MTRADGEPKLGDVHGVGGPVYFVRSGGLSAVVSDVPLEEFGEDAIEGNLARIEWIAATARAHQEILAAVSAAGTVLPMRLCTIYRDPDRVREMLEEHHEEFVAALTRLDGKQEWGVKLYCEPEALREKTTELSDEVTSFSSQIQGKSPGAAYFLKKRLEEMIDSEVERVRDAAAQRAHDRLASRAAEAVLCRLLGRDVTGRDDDMLLDAAYLVTRQAAQQFREELEAIRREDGGCGFTYELSGPWPPYNFAVVKDTPDDQCGT